MESYTKFANEKLKINLNMISPFGLDQNGI